jgi:hypothetical protein
LELDHCFIYFKDDSKSLSITLPSEEEEMEIEYKNEKIFLLKNNVNFSFDNSFEKKFSMLQLQVESQLLQIAQNEAAIWIRRRNSLPNIKSILSFSFRCVEEENESLFSTSSLNRSRHRLSFDDSTPQLGGTRLEAMRFDDSISLISSS